MFWTACREKAYEWRYQQWYLPPGPIPKCDFFFLGGRAFGHQLSQPPFSLGVVAVPPGHTKEWESKPISPHAFPFAHRARAHVIIQLRCSAQAAHHVVRCGVPYLCLVFATQDRHASSDNSTTDDCLTPPSVLEAKMGMPCPKATPPTSVWRALTYQLSGDKENLSQFTLECK